MGRMVNSLRARDFRNAGIQNLILKNRGYMSEMRQGGCTPQNEKGRKYFGCEDNPECDFMSWSRPVAEKCPKCGGYMVIKGNKIVCADEQCGYVTDRKNVEKDSE